MCYMNLAIPIVNLVNIQALYVTGYWKTDQNVTLGPFHFIGPADRYTHTLPMHCCINTVQCKILTDRRKH